MAQNELQKLMEAKRIAKQEIFDQLWPSVKKLQPLCIVFGAQSESFQKLLPQLLEGCSVLPLKVLVVNKNASAKDEIQANDQVCLVQDFKAKMNTYLLAADMGLIFEDSEALLKNLFAQGIVPIGLEKTPFLQNYHPNEETGNSFTFTSANAWAIFAALVRANETYRFPYDWQHIVRMGRSQ